MSFSNPVPPIADLPAEALLTRKQLVALTGFSEDAFKKWMREGRGPAVVHIEGRPRTTVAAYRAWVAGEPRASA